MSIIANSSVDKVKFDSTIECTIIDATDKLTGKYKVKNESYAEFYAYSQITTYNKGDKVYVQIPKGDYNSTKFIVGKKTDKNEDKPYNFVNPFNTFIDLTGNFLLLKIIIKKFGVFQLMVMKKKLRLLQMAELPLLMSNRDLRGWGCVPISAPGLKRSVQLAVIMD